MRKLIISIVVIGALVGNVVTAEASSVQKTEVKIAALDQLFQVLPSSAKKSEMKKQLAQVKRMFKPVQKKATK